MQVKIDGGSLRSMIIECRVLAVVVAMLAVWTLLADPFNIHHMAAAAAYALIFENCIERIFGFGRSDVHIKVLDGIGVSTHRVPAGAVVTVTGEDCGV